VTSEAVNCNPEAVVRRCSGAPLYTSATRRRFHGRTKRLAQQSPSLQKLRPTRGLQLRPSIVRSAAGNVLTVNLPTAEHRIPTTHGGSAKDSEARKKKAYSSSQRRPKGRTSPCVRPKTIKWRQTVVDVAGPFLYWSSIAKSLLVFSYSQEKGLLSIILLVWSSTNL